jgi:hypothetical protein
MVKDDPEVSVAPDQVYVHVLDVVVADDPVPVSGLSTAPAGTASLVQCAPLGTLNVKEKCEAFEGPLFLKVIVPHQFGPSYTFCVIVNEHELVVVVPHTLATPPPPHVCGEVQVPQLSVPPQPLATEPQFFPRAEHVVGVQVVPDEMETLSKVPVASVPFR